VKAVKGDVSKKADVQRRWKRPTSSRCAKLQVRNNHFPIQNFYLQDVVKNAQGELVLKTVATIVENDQDRFHDKCSMK